MAYQKKKMPREIRKLEQRVERFKQVVALGEINNTELLEAGINQIEKVSQSVHAYNEVLRQADELRDRIDKQTRVGQDIHERIRQMVIAAFGRDSREYQMLGGVRKSDIDYGPKGNRKK